MRGCIPLIRVAQSGHKMEGMRSMLGRFGLSGHHHLQPIAKLSGAERVLFEFNISLNARFCAPGIRAALHQSWCQRGLHMYRAPKPQAHGCCLTALAADEWRQLGIRMHNLLHCCAT